MAAPLFRPEPEFASFMVLLTDLLHAATYPWIVKEPAYWQIVQSQGEINHVEGLRWQYMSRFKPTWTDTVFLDTKTTYDGKEYVVFSELSVHVGVRNCNDKAVYGAQAAQNFSAAALPIIQRWLFGSRFSPSKEILTAGDGSNHHPQFLTHHSSLTLCINPYTSNEQLLELNRVEMFWTAVFSVEQDAPPLETQARFFVERLSGFWLEYKEMLERHLGLVFSKG